MAEQSVDAEYDTLKSVRVLTPGFETYLGNLDPEANLFFDSFSVPEAQEEHREMVETLENEGVEVRQLYEDLQGEPMHELMDELTEIDASRLDGRETEVRERIEENWRALDPRAQLQLVMSKPTLQRHPPEVSEDDRSVRNGRGDNMSITMETPATNMFFQRDQQLLGDKGPVMCQMYYDNRKGEMPVVEKAWDALGADIQDPVSDDQSIEGGEFIPAGDFALIGVESPEGDVLRTTYGAAEDILEAGAVGYDEVGLVKAPKEKAEQMAEEYGTEADMDIMHLDTWFNIAAEGLAVMNEELAESTEVDVYQNNGDEYVRSETQDFDQFLEEKGYDWVDIPGEELPNGANFLTIDDGKVLAIYHPDEEGQYDPGQNQTIEAMRDAGVDVVPDGTGMNLENLTNGYGGAHCMTTPLNRE